MNTTDLVRWIEEHPATVDVLKWTGIMVVAWVTGAFSFPRNLTRKPRVKISGITSRCFLETHTEFNGIENAQSASLLLDIQVANRSSVEIVVWTLDVQVLRPMRLRRWGLRISAASLPNRVRHQMGSGEKVLRNWFASFPDEFQQLTIDGHLPPNHATSGFALFVSFTHGNWNPVVRNNAVRARVSVGLTTGKVIRVKAWIPVSCDAEFFEGMVPGILDQIRHPTSCNLPLRHS